MWYIGTIVSTCNWDKGHCLLCCLLIGKPIGDCCNGNIAIGDVIANTLVVDQIGIGSCACTVNSYNCCCYTDYCDKIDILINNHFPFVVACDTKNGYLKFIDRIE